MRRGRGSMPGVRQSHVKARTLMAADSHSRPAWQLATALVPFTGTRWCRPCAQVAAATALTSFRRSTSACQGKSGTRVPRHQARRGRPLPRTSPPRARGASAVCARAPRNAGSLVRNTSRSGPRPRCQRSSLAACAVVPVRHSASLVTAGDIASGSISARTADVCFCRCDTRSHLESELADWRTDYVGRVVPGACSRPAPPCRASPVTAGCEAPGKAPTGRPSHPGDHRRGAGRTGESRERSLMPS
jgi:hypothetical protein